MAGLRLVLVALVFTVTIVHAIVSIDLKKQYALSDKTATWDEAKRLCEEEGQTLAIVTSADDQGRLRTALRNKGAGLLDCYWIGATNVGCAGSDFCWFGDSSTPVTYSDWGLNPLGILSLFRTDKCVKVWTQEAHWYDVGCNLRFKYACEYYSS